MKKTIISAAIAAVAITGLITVNRQASSEAQLNEIQLANLEALAEEEETTDPSICFGCGTSEKGAYCCTVKFIGAGGVVQYFTLYKPATLIKP